MIWGKGKLCPKCEKLVTSHRHESRCGYRGAKKLNKKWNNAIKKNNTQVKDE